MSTAQDTSSARPSTSHNAGRIADSSLVIFLDHTVAPVSSTTAAQWWALPASMPAQTRVLCSLNHISSTRTVFPRPEEPPAVVSVNSDQHAHLNQQPGRPGEPDGHSFGATKGKTSSATSGPPGPPNNLRRSSWRRPTHV